MLHITEKDCICVMEEVLKGKPFEIANFILQPFSEVKGFHGSHALLKIAAKVGEVEKEYTFFTKIATMNQEVFDRHAGRQKMYLKEHVMITKLMKELENAVKTKLTCACYLSRLNKFMVLENLSDVGYETIRVKGGMDYTHAEITVRTVADFHAASFLLEETGTSITEKYPIMGKESFLSIPEGDKPDECLLVSCVQGVRKWAEKITSDIPENVRETAFAKAFETVKTLTASRKYRNVMCHGDLWGNNIMYKYEGDTPTQGILLDFQASRYAPPAVDLMQFFYVALSKDIREEHGRDLLDTYYTRLSETLTRFGADVDSIIPRKDFEESCKDYKDFGISIRMYYSYITRIPERYLLPAVDDVELFLGLMVCGDPRLPLLAAEDKGYNEELSEAIREAVLFYTGYSTNNVQF